ncbi:hypothetical protein [Bacillus sinesaloumensis]|uniref:hypothetical protein n=1 Tax=Litchfieldia sinesaloumensis TaxID=1926280 RepID=UPI00098869E9|nr:hypothetical protein [Bacillus sinesaloumensis]
MEIYIVLAVFYLSFFTWLSLSYIRNSNGGTGDSKRKRIYVGFLLTLSLFHFFGNTVFELNASYGLPITTAIILLFSIYMSMVVVKDKKTGKVIEESK